MSELPSFDLHRTPRLRLSLTDIRPHLASPEREYATPAITSQQKRGLKRKSISEPSRLPSQLLAPSLLFTDNNNIHNVNHNNKENNLILHNNNNLGGNGVGYHHNSQQLQQSQLSLTQNNNPPESSIIEEQLILNTSRSMSYDTDALDDSGSSGDSSNSSMISVSEFCMITPKKKKRRSNNYNFLSFISFKRGAYNNIKYISTKEFKNVLLQKEKKSIKIIDCRYDYEYEAGHFIGGMRCSTREGIENLYIKTKEERDLDIYFHCELSICRGPRAAEYLACLYQTCANENCPNIYIIKGGYAKFFSENKYNPQIGKCIKPIGYLKESSEKFRCNISRSRSKKSWKGVFKDDVIEDPFITLAP